MHRVSIPGLRVFVDFEKAFDTIEWAFVEKSFRHSVCFLSSSLMWWINLFYCDTESCVINNGWSTGFFSTCKAGLSSLALHFYLVRRGVGYNHTECKLSQYMQMTPRLF